MVSRRVIFWDVDTQADFMCPDGKLYVPGAEKLIPNLKRLTEAGREGRVLILGDVDAHTPHDEEFRRWPPHCLVGTPGQNKIPQTLTDRLCWVANLPGEPLPERLDEYQQVILEKQTLDVFDNPNAERVLEQLNRVADADAEFVVFGVVTEYCVCCAAKGLLDRGKRVALVTDAVETLDPATGKKTLDVLTARGARLITTEQALASLAPTGQMAGVRQQA